MIIADAATFTLKARPLTNEAVESILRSAFATASERFTRIAMRRVRRGKPGRDRILAAAEAALRDPSVQRAIAGVADEVDVLLSEWSLGEDLEDLIFSITPNETPFLEALRDDLP